MFNFSFVNLLNDKQSLASIASKLETFSKFEQFSMSTLASCFQNVSDGAVSTGINDLYEVEGLPGHLFRLDVSNGYAISAGINDGCPVGDYTRPLLIDITPRRWDDDYVTILHQYKNHDGYNIVSGTQTSTHRVCRLVANAWCSKPEDYDTEVDHVNANKDDDRAYNLEWVTHSENIRRGRMNGYKPPHKWEDTDHVLLASPGGDILDVKPKQVRGITKSTNTSHALVRGNRKTLGGWHFIVNPTDGERAEFVNLYGKKGA